MIQPQNNKKCRPRDAAAFVPLDGELLLPPSRRRMDLKTLKQVRLEMAHVYREIRNGELYSSEGARLVYVLGSIAKLIEQSDFEARLDRLEKTTEASIQ